MLIDNHYQEKEEIESENKRERENALSDSERALREALRELREDYERRLHEITSLKDTERESLRSNLE